MRALTETHKLHNLTYTRESLILFTFYASVVISFIMLFIDIYENRYTFAAISASSVVINMLFIYLAQKGYSQIALIFSEVVFLLFAFNEGYYLQIPLQSVMYFSLIPIFLAILIESNYLRVSFLIIWVTAFVILNMITQTHNWASVFIYLAITPVGFGIMLFFVKIMEDQQEQLIAANADKKKNLAKLKVKHDEMLLFNDMMNHDIKAPLRTIQGFTSLLSKKTAPTKEQIEYLDFISDSANNLESLISDLLILSKINTTEIAYAKVNVNKLVDQVCLSLSYDIKKHNVTFLIEDIPPICGNPELLRTVVQNIISNAIKYQPKETGHIPKINISYIREKEFDTIYFQDNGIGIEENDVPNLFDPFVRFHDHSTYEGTGLGMTICKKIMQKHKGDIQYFSNQKAGTCIKLQLPKPSLKKSEKLRISII